LLGAGAAVAISAAALMLPTLLAPDRQPGDPALSPFAYYRVIVMHALTTVLLSWMIAEPFVPAERSARWWTLWTFAGIGVAGLTITLGRGVGAQLDATQVFYSPGAVYIVRMIVRILWCLALQLPWCVLARALAEPPTKPQTSRSIVQTAVFPLVVALLVPIGYLNVLIVQQTIIINQAWERENLVKARGAVVRLCNLGSYASLGTVTTSRAENEEIFPRSALAELDQQIAVLRQDVAYFRSVPLTDEMRCNFAKRLAVLNELEEAEEVIKPVARHNQRAAFILADVYREAQQWRRSNEWYRRSIELLRAAEADGTVAPERSEEIQRSAYDSLAANYLKLKQYDRTEEVYFEAIERLPAAEAHFHYRLSEHYASSGRASLAEKHLQKARNLLTARGLDPDQWCPKPVGTTLRLLTTGSPVGIFAPAGKSEEKQPSEQESP
jgi:tetratricopeptide (TPR) repeat protein